MGAAMGIEKVDMVMSVAVAAAPHDDSPWRVTC